jgi:RNA polymerase sigma-70 factor, ECF subfamily
MDDALPTASTPLTATAGMSAAHSNVWPAFAQVVASYQQQVYGYLHARLLEPADAEDLTQEVFLRFYMAREQSQPEVDLGLWLGGIARNVLREHARKLTRRREILWTELCLAAEDKTILPAENPALPHLPRCLEALGPSAREAIDLRYAQQLSLEAIAAKLTRSEGAVKLLMHRARQALRHCLERSMSREDAPA